MIILLVKVAFGMGLFSMVSAGSVDAYVPVLNGLHTEVSALMDPVINSIKGFFGK